MNKIIRKLKILDLVFILELIVFTLIIAGAIPRIAALYLALGLSVYVIASSLENATILFIRSIPLFIALPITPGFDNFNTWRILSITIFIKWALPANFIKLFKKQFDFYKKPISFIKESPVYFLLTVLLALSILSTLVAPDATVAIKRVIYFLNLSLVGIVVYDLVTHSESFRVRLIKNVTIPIIIATIAGFIQLISTYRIDIYQFIDVWGREIQLRQFGAAWSDIAVRLGNTWFAYYGDQLSLRMFSLFPDSHSFPIFLLLGMPAILAWALIPIIERGERFKQLMRIRGKLFVLWVPLIFLAAILSGTRGIWAGSIGVVLLAALIIVWMRHHKIDIKHRAVFKYAASFIISFFLLFSIAYPIFVSPQFLLSKGDSGLLKNRLRSIIDFGETSNAQRIEIWRQSVVSIKKHPSLGVGIGNFPVVLNKDIFLAKAGATAHNIYLHIAAEIGIPALIAALWFLWILFKQTYNNFVGTKDPLLLTYYGSALLFIPWVLAYSLTDAALFDERAFLMFAVVVASILGTKKESI